MPRLVQKSGYIRAGGAGRYARYIATREGVEKLHGRGPATQGQNELIKDVLRDYPDSRELFEYEDYRANPTFANASAFLTMALDANVHTMEEGSVYLKYIATRPRVERRGDHGLFSDRQIVSLPDTMAEVEQHQGPVWTVICSLRREDAAALGYDHAERWRTLLMQHQAKLAQAMKIPADQFRWCAAFHDEGHHPHIHMMVWSADPKKGFLTRDGIHAMRSVLTNTIFQDEMHELYEKKDLAYRELVTQARTAMVEHIGRMESADTADPVLAGKLAELSCALNSVTGKKQYGYLPKHVKALVDDVVNELARQPDVAACYETWNGLRDELERYYKDRPRERRPLSEQKEFRAVKNVIVREAERLRQELEQMPRQKEEQTVRVETESEEETWEPSSEGTSETRTVSEVRRVPDAAAAAAVLNLLHHMGQIFRDNTPAPANPMGVRMDSKRRKKLQAKRLAMGHKMDDHENPEIPQTMQ